MKIFFHIQLHMNHKRTPVYLLLSHLIISLQTVIRMPMLVNNAAYVKITIYAVFLFRLPFP